MEILTFIPVKVLAGCNLILDSLSIFRNLMVVGILLFSGIADQILAQVSFQWQAEKVVRVSFDNLDLAIVDLSIFVKNHQSPLLGKWTLDHKTYHFRPAIPFSRGVTYNLKENNHTLFDFEIEDSGRTLPTKLSAIYPSTDFVPENLLKIHLYFSAPMGELHSGDFITVTTGEGDTLRNTFLALQPELWNSKRDQLTLWLDPGRIKRGLIPNQDQGLPMTNGETYHIYISRDWKDNNGWPLESSFEKEFTARAADRTKPTADSFEVIEAPSSGSMTPLIVDLSEPLDYALAEDCFLVLRGGESLPGKAVMNDQNSLWTFIPEAPWRSGTHQLQINSRLEDLAGNNFIHLFDKDVTAEAPPQVSFYFLDFVIN